MCFDYARLRLKHPLPQRNAAVLFGGPPDFSKDVLLVHQVCSVRSELPVSKVFDPGQFV